MRFSSFFSRFASELAHFESLISYLVFRTLAHALLCDPFLLLHLYSALFLISAHFSTALHAFCSLIIPLIFHIIPSPSNHAVCLVSVTIAPIIILYFIIF